ncbi:Protein translocase subunit SecY [uncultured archaeon]|nr:Protein translocase subunit SecY [uncultured archaeon]
MLNVQLLGLVLSSAGLPLLGTFQNNQPVSGIALYVTPLQSPLLTTGGYAGYLDSISSLQGILHILVYGIVLIALSVLFGWFWVQSTGMDAASVSSQLNSAGLNISGYRQDPRITQRILENYIPAITILGSFGVAVLAWFADITGALGTGTGILLAVGIIYKLWEDLTKQEVFQSHPSFGGLF